MSLGLAVQMVAFYTSMINQLAQEIEPLERKLMSRAAKGAKDAKADEIDQLKLTKFKTLMRMAQEFLEFWKEAIKAFLSMIKAFNEIAFSGGR